LKTTDCVAHNNDILCQKNNFETGDPKKRGKEKRKNHSNETQPEKKRKHMWIPSLAQQCLQALPKSAQVKNSQFSLPTKKQKADNKSTIIVRTEKNFQQHQKEQVTDESQILLNFSTLAKHGMQQNFNENLTK